MDARHAPDRGRLPGLPRYQLPLRDVIGFGASGPGTIRQPSERPRQGEPRRPARHPAEGPTPGSAAQFGDRDLCGGPWQRIALARAFYREADLVILDEPTAALDPKAEQALFERFADLMHDRTAIMISHRLGSARFADRIVVMDQGEMVEDGSHDDLMAENGSMRGCLPPRPPGTAKRPTTRLDRPSKGTIFPARHIRHACPGLSFRGTIQRGGI